MAIRCTIYLDDVLDKKIIQYMKQNEITMKSVAIKICVEQFLTDDWMKQQTFEINEKLNRILYRQNINKKVLEQLFVNFGFPVNYEVAKDKLLKEVYERNNSYKGRYD